MPECWIQDNVTRYGILSSAVSPIVQDAYVSEPTDPRERLWFKFPGFMVSRVAVNAVIQSSLLEVYTSSDLTVDTYIDELPAQHARDYELLMAIPVHLEAVEDAVIAHFREARLLMSGVDHEDATVSLLDWILDSFDDLEAADPGTIGEDLENQIRVLRKHLRRRS